MSSVLRSGIKEMNIYAMIWLKGLLEKELQEGTILLEITIKGLLDRLEKSIKNNA